MKRPKKADCSELICCGSVRANKRNIIKTKRDLTPKLAFSVKKCASKPRENKKEEDAKIRGEKSKSAPLVVPASVMTAAASSAATAATTTTKVASSPSSVSPPPATATATKTLATGISSSQSSSQLKPTTGVCNTEKIAVPKTATKTKATPTSTSNSTTATSNTTECKVDVTSNGKTIAMPSRKLNAAPAPPVPPPSPPVAPSHVKMSGYLKKKRNVSALGI